MQEAGFSFFASIFFFLQKKKKSEKCFGAELLGSLSDIGGMITGENRGGNQTGYIDASGNYHQRTCFVAGTKVYTKDGLKNIEEIKIGDKVLSWNPETGKLEYRTITNLFERKTDLIYKLTFSSGRTVETTWNHPFWVSSTGTSTGSVSDISSLQAGKWIETKDLKVGDVLKTANSSPLFISAISTDARMETVYNFEVEGNHTYFVGEDGVLVHNQSASYAIMEAGAVIAPINPVAGAVVVGMGVGVLACASNPNCNKQAEGYVTQGVNAVKGFFSDGLEKVKGWMSEGDGEEKNKGTFDDIWDDARQKSNAKGNVKQKEKVGDFNDAKKDYDTILGKEKNYPDNVSVKTLPDGSRVVVKPKSTDGSPTLEKQTPNGKPIKKIRYVPE